MSLFYACIYLSSGLFLHPVLKLFYREGYGNVKNTVSVLDMGIAVVALSIVRLVVAGIERVSVSVSKTKLIPLHRRLPLLFRVTFLPGLCIFLAVVLATYANYESFFFFMILAPLELVFVLILIHLTRWQNPENRITPYDLACAFFILAGGICVTVDHVRKMGSSGTGQSPPDGYLVAVMLCLVFRFTQAVNSVVLRKACLDSGKKLREDVRLCDNDSAMETAQTGENNISDSRGQVVTSHSGNANSNAEAIRMMSRNNCEPLLLSSNLQSSQSSSTISLREIMDGGDGSSLSILDDVCLGRMEEGRAKSENNGEKESKDSTEAQQTTTQDVQNLKTEENQTQTVENVKTECSTNSSNENINLPLILDLAICKLIWVTAFLFPYGLITEGLTKPWSTLWGVLSFDSNSGNNDSTKAFVYLLLTIFMTCVFQFAHVGMLASFPVLRAVSIVQLQPLCQVKLAFFLELIASIPFAFFQPVADAARNTAIALGMGEPTKFLSMWNCVGCALLLVGATSLRNVKRKRAMV